MTSLDTSLLVAYLCMAKALHKRGALDVSDLVNEVGEAIDFRKQQGSEEGDLLYLKMIYDALLKQESAGLPVRRQPGQAD